MVYGVCGPLEKALHQLLLEPGMPAIDFSLDGLVNERVRGDFVYCKPVDFDIAKARIDLKEWVDVDENVEKLNLEFLSRWR